MNQLLLYFFKNRFCQFSKQLNPKTKSFSKIGPFVLLICFLSGKAFAQYGALDCSFGNNGLATLNLSANSNTAQAIAVFDNGTSMDGKIAVAGNYYDGTNSQFGVAIFNEDGTPYTTFNGTGWTWTSFDASYKSQPYGIAIQSDDKIVVAGIGHTQDGGMINTDELAMARFNTDGTLDATFGSSGKVFTPLGPTNNRNDEIYDMVIDASDNIYVAGGKWTNASTFQRASVIYKTDSDGNNGQQFVCDVIPTSSDFGSPVIDEAFYGLTIHGGNIYAVGYYEMTENGDKAWSVAKMSTSGVKDNNFGTNGIATMNPTVGQADWAYDVGVQSDGTVVVMGEANNDFAVVKLNAAGVVQNTFTFEINGTDDCKGGLVLSDDKILLYGNNNSNLAFLRLNADATLDNTFGSSGKQIVDHQSRTDYVYDVAIQSDGKIVSAGSWSNPVGTTEFAATRLIGDDLAMSYCCGEVVQQTDEILKGYDGEILKIKICAPGNLTPESVTQMNFTTNGSTNAITDLASAKLYYTGTSDVYSQTTQFGSTVSSPNGSFAFNGAQVLSSGTNYFWLVYTTKSTATSTNVVDAVCTNYTLTSGTFIPTDNNPTGNRNIVDPHYPYITPYDPTDNAYNWITNVTLGTINNSTGKSTDANNNENAYTDYSATYSATVNAGSTYNMSVTIQAPTAYGEYVRGYFDWNSDYDFTDDGEEIIIASDNATSGTVTVNKDIVIPVDASGTIRLRVTCDDNAQYGGSVTGGNLGYGEAEDYTINVVGANTAPTITTQGVSSITTTTATGNGNITDIGGQNITERGIYYSTTDGFADGAGTKVSTTGDWSDASNFTQPITSLTPGTTYYLKAFATNSAGTGYGSQISFTTLAPPTITTTPDTTVAYDNTYNYSIVATTEGELETALTAPTLPSWLTFSSDGQNQALLFGNVPSGTSLSGVAGDDDGNIYAITSNGTTIYKISSDGTTTLWRNGLISGSIYALHIANGYIYIPRYMNNTASITRIPLNNPSAAEETFASISGGALSLIDKDGWIYASEINGYKVYRINETTKENQLFLSSANGLNSYPFGLCFDPEGNLYIAGWSYNTILKYDGSSLSTVLSGLPSSVSSIKLDKKGNFYLSMQNGGVRKYTNDFSSYEVVSVSANDNIWSLSFTSTGALVYSIFGTNQVYRLQTGAILTGTPSKSNLGDHPVVIRATNSVGYTEQSFTISVVDTVKPAIATTSPANGATDVALKPSMSITFDEGVILGTTGTLTLKSGSDTLASFDLSIATDRNAFTQSADKKTFSFDVTHQLPTNTLVAVEISKSFVKDSSDNAFAGITAASGDWDFTTIANTPPSIVNAPASITFTEDVTGNVDLSGISVSDNENDPLTLTLSVDSGTFGTPADGSSIGSGVTETLVNSTTITLAGSAADITSYLQTVSNIKYTGALNANGTAAATLTITPNDGTVNGTAKSVDINISAMNDDPTISGLPTDITLLEDIAGNVDLSAATFNDPDSGSGSDTLKLEVENGTLSASSGGGVTVGGSGTVKLTLAGTVANIDTYLNTASNIKYTGALNVNGNNSTTLTLTANDGGNTGTGGGTDVSLGSVNINITPVNDPPVITGMNGESSEVTAGAGAQQVILFDDATVTNVDSPDYNGGSLTIAQGSGTVNGSWGLDGTSATSGGDATISAGETITVGSSAIGTVHATNDGQGGNTLKLDFNTANATNDRIQTLLQALSYSAPSGLGARVFTLTLNDADGTANGGDQDASASFTVNITPNPPVISYLDGDNLVIPVGGTAGNIDVDGNATVTDPDNANFNTGNMTITQNTGTANGSFSLTGSGSTGVSSGTSTLNADGTISASEIIFVDGTAIASVSSSSDGQSGNNLILNFGSNATPARTQTLLRGLKYAAPSGAGDRTFTIYIKDASSSGATGSANFTVTVTPPEMDLFLETTPVASGSSVDLGVLTFGQMMDTTFTIQNNGTGDLFLITPIVTAGADASEFSITQQPSALLDPAGETTFTIHYEPAFSGTKTAMISIANNDSDENPYIINLKASCISGPSIYTLTPTEVKDTSATIRGSISNDGNVPILAKGFVLSKTDYLPTMEKDQVIQFKDISGRRTFTTPVYPLEPGTKYYYRAYATNVVGTAYGNSMTFTTEMGNQQITLADPVISKMYGVPDFDPMATASSGLPVSYSSSDENVATIVDGMIHITGLGSCMIFADQTGNDQYYPASQDTIMLTVSEGTATINLEGLSTTYNGSPQMVTATTMPEGLAVNITYDGNATAPTDAGKYLVTATLDDPNFEGSVSDTLVIEKAGASVNIGGLEAVYNGNSHEVTTTTTPEGLTVGITYNDSLSTPSDAGTYQVTAIVIDANYAGSATAQLVISKAMATVEFDTLAAGYDGDPKPLTVTTSPEGLNVDITYDGSMTAPSDTGTYAVVATINDPNYEGSASGSYVIAAPGNPTAVDNVAFEGQVKVYPTATKGVVHVQVDNSKFDVQVFNLAGQKLQIIRNVQNNLDLNMADYHPGMYILRIKIGEQFVSKRVIRQ